MTEPDHGKPTDPLIQRYQEASAEDTRRPASKVREAVRAHAQLMVASKDAIAQATQAPAANQSRWKISLLASIALAGITGLLVLQIDRGTPDEQEAAYGRPSPSAPPAVVASPTQPAAPSLPAPAAMSEKAAPAAPPSTAPTPARKSAAETKEKNKAEPSPSAADAKVARNGRVNPDSQSSTLPHSPAPAAPPPEATQAAPPARLGDAASGNTSMAEAASASRAATSPAPARAAPPSASITRGPAMMQKQDGLSSQLPYAEAPTTTSGTADLTAALHEAARTGRIPQLERALQQGAPINATNGAGQTALMLAVIHGQTATVQRLLTLGANKALLDRDGSSALQHARRLGLDRIASIIEAHS